MQKILIVEDDLSIQALLHDFIQEAGYSVVLAADGVEALARYSEQTFDLILLYYASQNRRIRRLRGHPSKIRCTHYHAHGIG